jgi:hypothetical protein
MQTSLGLTAQDNYHDVVRKLGQPEKDRWKNDESELNFRILEYPQRGLWVILMGRERDSVRYVGAADLQGRVVDSVEMPGGANTAAVVRQAARK